MGGMFNAFDTYPLYDNDPGHGATRVLGLFLLLYSSPTDTVTRTCSGNRPPVSLRSAHCWT
jgi:hypothetical protein